MSDKKIYKKLPSVLQTTAIKNFFESTVEQLFSKAEVEQIQGFIGAPRNADVEARGNFLREPTVTKRFYGLTPAVNTINETTGKSENLFFYDELIDTLSTYNVSTSDHNKIFSDVYSTYLPPIDVDKLLNYSEYYWYPQGPTAISVEGNLAQSVNIDSDIIGKTAYTLPNGTALRNGMNIVFTGDFVIPNSKTGIQYIVEGVGESIMLIPRTDEYVNSPAVSNNRTEALVTYENGDIDTFLLLGGVADFDVTSVDVYTQTDPGYIAQQRGAQNRNNWSVVNHWYHKDNFIDAGDELPNRQFRANRPIVEFERDLELYNHGHRSLGYVVVASDDIRYSDLDGAPTATTVDGVPILNATILFPNEQKDIAQYIYSAVEVAGAIQLQRIADPTTNVADTYDGDDQFVALTPQLNDVVQVLSGDYNLGNEYMWTRTGWQLTQFKSENTQQILFNLYDYNGNYLGDQGMYPANNFAGNPIFNFATDTNDIAGATKSVSADTELGFPLVFRQFKTSSEILFENYIDTVEYAYTPINGDQTVINGYKYYKKTKDDTSEYHSLWKTVTTPSRQRIVTTYELTQVDIDRSLSELFIGCVPDVAVNKVTGLDIDVYVNGELTQDYTYSREGFIQLNTALTAGDFIEISADSASGLISKNSVSKYELPLSWTHNVLNKDIEHASEPEYLSHFKNYMEQHANFEGLALGANNFSNLAKQPRLATDIIKTNQDVVLGTFLLDDQPHNLVDALRFNAKEYTKYKKRLTNEIEKFFKSKYNSNYTTEQSLEQVLRNLISYKVGSNVFNRTYIVPYGDNYAEEKFTAALDQRVFTLSNYADLDKIENSLLVYKNDQLLCVDNCYVISNFNPITVVLLDRVQLTAGDVITTKIYNAERDSAECPPTPSTMGLYPLFQPAITVDNTFQTPLDVIIGHDGSITPAWGDYRDELLLTFERRIYNSAKAEFREANALPAYSVFNVRSGAFRSANYSYNEWHDLLRHQYAGWVTSNKVDPTVNEFYSEDNSWTWNYGDTSTPGHWRGLYEYYYDTQRPHTHPWEMLGFTEKPLWWDTEYVRYSDKGTVNEMPYVSYDSSNLHMWSDLEEGIIRQGARENVSDNSYLTNNPYRRIGLHEIVPVDSAGALIAPYDLFDTGTTAIQRVWDNSAGTQLGYKTSSFLNNDGINVYFDGNELSGNVYVSSKGILNYDPGFEINSVGHVELDGKRVEEQPTSYVIPSVDLTQQHNVNSPMVTGLAVAALVNGLPLYNTTYGVTWNNDGLWTYDQVKRESTYGTGYVGADKGLIHYHVITPESAGLVDWDASEVSDIVGWAFDGLPIYGPYVHSDPVDNTSSPVRYQSSWRLREGTRNVAPGGAHDGTFIEDYVYDSTLDQYAGNGKWNLRYGVTKHSSVPILHYVVSVDEDHNPVFPYHVGGGVTNKNGIGISDGLFWANRFYGSSASDGRIGKITVDDQGGLYSAEHTTIVIEGDGNDATAEPVIVDGKLQSVTITNAGRDYTTATATVVDSSGTGVRAKVTVQVSENNNSTSNAVIDTDATHALISVSNITQTASSDTAADWKFGDGAPVEHVWKTSESYPFAIAEALLLARPGRFATIFSDPTKLFTPALDSKTLLSTNTGKQWHFDDEEDFRIHGDVNGTDFITNIGYTQFVNSWLQYQGLTTEIDFAPKLRSLNTKLAHRMSGFVDKDTVVARTDQYSASGNATSLIIPSEDYILDLHNSNYKSRAYYTGVVIEKTAQGYKVRGYDTTRNYFEILESNKQGKRERISVGGNPVAHSVWEPSVTYSKGTIVEYLNSYYIAPVKILASASFERTTWDRLPSLPQEGAARATLYQQSTGNIVRVDYETVFTRIDDVYDFLISLGRYQESVGFQFGEYQTDINTVSNWAYSAKQFLFWTTGKWEIGNTLELSPLAGKARFEAPRGFIAKINRTDRDQFALLDQNGAVINPMDCAIIREDNVIEVVAPGDQQVYGMLIYTKEIEHAMVFNNLTQFNDVIFDDQLNQRHTRIRVKGQRTANWTGKLLSHGFIVDGEELLPNLDNMAESLGRYHELGFIPVEKQIYQASRALFGFSDKEYLRELDVLDDQQFEFYRGMIQSKGTAESLTRLAKSSSIVQGNVTVYDEWALRVGDFGDTENEQSIELLINKEDIVQEPQLLTLDFPESITNIVERIDVLDARYTYTDAPEIQISNPNPGGLTAQAQAVLDAEGKLAQVTVLDPGSNYPDNTTAQVIVANVVIDNQSEFLSKAVASSNSYVTFAPGYSITITTDTTPNAVISGTTLRNLIENINSSAQVNADITAGLVESHISDGANVEVKESIIINGSSFEIVDGANVNITNGIYEPQQRFAILTAEATAEYETTVDDIKLTNDGVTISRLKTDGVTANWQFSAGEVVNVNPDTAYPRLDLADDRVDIDGNSTLYFPVLAGSNTVTVDLGGNVIATENLEVDSNNRYKFVDVFINGIRIRNSVNSFDEIDTVAGADILTHGTLFVLTENSITFPDISRLPKSVLTQTFNPPIVYDTATGRELYPAENQQRQLMFSLTPDTEIKIVEKSTVEFTDEYEGDLPGSRIVAKVTSREGIVARVSPRRNYALTADDKNDDAILIDIDDTTRFLKRPIGAKGSNLWPTTSSVDHTGLTDAEYSIIPNSGYVNAANVNFQAFDLASLPDLYSEDLIIKPTRGDYIHVAKSENNNWNVYQLTATDATKSFLRSEATGETSLYTDYSLFNYLDTNQIGETNTGQYLDYYLTLDNANVSDNVVVWRNEEIVRGQSYELRDFEAPKMVEARIASIKPRNLVTITDVEPADGRIYNNLAATPLEGNTVLISGNNFTDIEENDAVRLFDNVGTSYNYSGSYSLAGTTLTVNARHISVVSVDNAGENYAETPVITVSASPTGDTATATAIIVDGELVDVTLENTGSGYTGTPTVSIEAPGLSSVTVTDGGSGYDANNPPTVTVAPSSTGHVAIAQAVIRGGEVQQVLLEDAGHGYSSAPAITISAPESGTTASATAVVSDTAQVSITVSNGVQELADAIALNGPTKIQLSGSVNAELAFRIDPPLTATEQQLVDDVTTALAKPYTVTAVNETTGTFTVQSDSFTADIIDNIDTTGYTVVQYLDYAPESGEYYTVSNVTDTSFTIQRANSEAGTTLSLMHLNKSMVTVPGHNFVQGDTVRMYTNRIGGMFTVQSVIGDKIVVPAKYVAGFTEGEVIQEGIEIKTIGDHGISNLYAQSNKRIAVHFAEPLYYNKVYPVSQVTPDSIIVNGFWPKDRQSYHFYEELSATLNGSVPYEAGNVDADFANATNVVPVTSDVRLGDYLVTYNSNSDIISPAHITTTQDYYVVDASALPANTALSAGITVARQLKRSSNRYPVLTTLDHNKVTFNGSTIEIDQYNDTTEIAKSINKTIQMRRAFVKPKTNNSTGFGLTIPLIKDASKTTATGAYVTDETELTDLLGDELTVTGSVEIPGVTDTQNQTSQIGPHKGLRYYNAETGTEYKWDANAKKYRAMNTSNAVSDLDAGETTATTVYKAPEYHVSTVSSLSEILPWQKTTEDELAEHDNSTIAYLADAAVSFIDSYYVAKQDITIADNTTFDPALWEQVTNPTTILNSFNDALILKYIAGNGTDTNRIPGKKQKRYDMQAAKTFTLAGGSTATVPVYRLMPNLENNFSVYQAVQHASATNTVYYVLVDKVTPPNAPHDFYGTVNTYSEFLGYQTTDYYYRNNIVPALNGSNQITNAADPVVLRGSGEILDLPPVEPAAFVGKQLIAEPFAVQAGNNTDSVANFTALPRLSIASSQSGNRAEITVSEAGYNKFLMWTAGLQPGKWEPTAIGPGPLPGINGNSTLFGYGRGYYTSGDNHNTADYPVVGVNGWNTAQPRFLYNKNFGVYPAVTNRDFVTYLDNNGTVISAEEYEAAADPVTGETPDDYLMVLDRAAVLDESNENTNDEGIRPEEIFVACFWTEPHLYRNQLTGWNYNNLTSAGTPSPIYSDYNGTICRVKYIRLTELPANAMTRRLIPDTGWAGKEWNNIRIDDAIATGLDEQEVWKLFAPSSLSGGSTGDAAESTTGINIANINAPVAGPTVNAQGDILAGDVASPSEIVPTTDAGPVLSGSVLESLPGPCAAIPKPELPVQTDPSGSADCKRAVTRYVYDVLTNRSSTFRKVATNWGYHSFKFYDEDAVRVFFDAKNNVNSPAIAIMLVQSTRPYDPDNTTWWTDAGTNARLLRDTRSDGTTPIDNSQQIGRYGVDPVDTLSNSVIDNRVNELLGITDNDVSGKINTAVDHASVQTDFIPRYEADAQLGCKGTGFIQRRADCANGEYITVFVSTSTDFNDQQSTTDLWSIVTNYRYEYIEETEQDNAETCEERLARSGSRFYQQGAIFRRWEGTNKFNSYFGTECKHEDGYTGHKNGTRVDNIYYPYMAYPQDLHGGVDPEDALQSALDDKVTMVEDKIITELAPLNTKAFNNKRTTFEVKGYFQAPVTGEYKFRGRADDGLWMWISSINMGGVRRGVDDLQDEYFVQDGYRANDIYNYTRENYLLRVGHKTTQTPFDKPAMVSDTVELEEGKYYFVRIIWGNRGGPGKYQLDYSVLNTNINGAGLTFSGRTCPTDNPPGDAEAPTVPPTDGGGGTNIDDNIVEGGSGNSGSANPQAGTILRQYCELNSSGNRTGVLIEEVADGNGGFTLNKTNSGACAPTDGGSRGVGGSGTDDNTGGITFAER